MSKERDNFYDKTYTTNSNVLVYVFPRHNSVLYPERLLYESVDNSRRGLSILRVDAHSDMMDGALATSLEEITLDYCEKIGFGEFTLAGIHTGLIDSLVWYDPHSNTIVDYGSREDPKRHRLPITYETISKGRKITQIDESGKKRNYYSGRKGQKVIKAKNMKKKSINLDNIREFYYDVWEIDLDAFASNYIENDLKDHDSINGWEKRLEQTISLLDKLNNPRAIFIIRSDDYFVPKELVDIIQNSLLEYISKRFGTLKEITL